MERPPVEAPAEMQAGSRAPTVPTPEEHALVAMSPPMLLGQMVTGGVAPLVVYELARHSGMSDAASLAVSAAPPALAIVVEWVWRRRLNVIGAIVLAGIVIGLTSLVFLHGNELMLKMRESVVTGLFGLACLVTLVLPMRPAMFHLGKALAAGSDRQRGHEFATLWEEPRSRRVFVILTLAWGAGFLLEAGMRAALALEVSTGRFLTLAPVIGWVVTGALIYWSIAYVRATRRKSETEALVEPANL